MASSQWRHFYIQKMTSFFSDVTGNSNFSRRFVFWNWIVKCLRQSGYVTKTYYDAIEVKYGRKMPRFRQVTLANLKNRVTFSYPELGTRYLNSSVATAAAIWRLKQRRCRYRCLIYKSSGASAAANGFKNSGAAAIRCRWNFTSLQILLYCKFNAMCTIHRYAYC